MSILTEFITEYAERLALPELREELEQWVQSADLLINQMALWLDQADSVKILRTVVDPNFELREEKFGAYRVCSLRIDLGARRVDIRPRGGAVGGVVPLKGGPTRIRGLAEMTNEIVRYRHYRIRDDSGEKWFLKHDDESEAKPLTRLSFENAMLHLLK